MNCKNCIHWVFGRCTVSNLVVGPGQLCNAWELSQSHEFVETAFASFSPDELQKRIAELEALVDQLIEAGQAVTSVAEWRYANLTELLAWDTLVDKIYKEREK